MMHNDRELTFFFLSQMETYVKAMRTLYFLCALLLSWCLIVLGKTKL